MEEKTCTDTDGDIDDCTGQQVHPVQKERQFKGKGEMIWRLVNGAMSVFFLLAAGVQFNDPDPYLWVPFYGVASLLTLAVAIRPAITNAAVWLHTHLLHGLYCAGMFVYVIVALVMTLNDPAIETIGNPLTYEEGRELAGILITSVWLFTCRQSPSIRYNEKDIMSSLCFRIVIVFSLAPLLLFALFVSSETFSMSGEYARVKSNI